MALRDFRKSSWYSLCGGIPTGTEICAEKQRGQLAVACHLYSRIGSPVASTAAVGQCKSQSWPGAIDTLRLVW